MRNIHPVEELAEIRAEMRVLKAREAQLRRFFLQDEAAREGPFHCVQVRRRKARVFDKARLPAVILADPRFYSDRISDEVRIVQTARECPLPGFSEVTEDFNVIEPCH